MPKVPQTGNVVPMQPQGPMPSETDFAMAAAMMHQEGRLFPQPSEDQLAPDAGEGEV